MQQEFHRKRWVLGCFLSLILPAILLAGAAQEYQVPVIYPILLLTLYLAVASVLVAFLSGLLYAQHKFEKNNISLGALLLVTIALALPLGFANLFWAVLDMESQNMESAQKTEVIWNFAIGLGILYIPAFFFAESSVALILHWKDNLAR